MATPFLKWAGGKRWFTSRYLDILPQKYNRYIEPFVGSGALFFALEPQEAVIGDINKPLVETYMAIKDDWKLVLEYLRTHSTQHSKEYYYSVRATLPETIHQRAARFIYLNRTCWNGLYRVNRAGNFNVPIGTKTNIILDTDDFKKLAKLLENTTIMHSDFEAIIDSAQEGDLVFADPPYTVKHNNNGFVKYNEDMFKWEDQVRLRDAIVRATERNVKIIVTNANHSSIVELYSEFERKVISRASVIAASNNNRGTYEELIIAKY